MRVRSALRNNDNRGRARRIRADVAVATAPEPLRGGGL